MLTMARMFMYVYMYIYIYIYTYTLCIYIYIYIYSISIYWRYFNPLRHCKKNICHDQVDLPAVPPARGLGTPILDLFILPSRILGWDNNYRNPNPNVKSLASSRSCRRILALLCFATFLGNNIRDQNATNGNDCFDLFDIPTAQHLWMCSPLLWWMLYALKKPARSALRRDQCTLRARSASTATSQWEIWGATVVWCCLFLLDSGTVPFERVDLCLIESMLVEVKPLGRSSIKKRRMYLKTRL